VVVAILDFQLPQKTGQMFGKKKSNTNIFPITHVLSEKIFEISENQRSYITGLTDMLNFKMKWKIKKMLRTIQVALLPCFSPHAEHWAFVSRPVKLCSDQ
jgi:hypothetical protein